MKKKIIGHKKASDLQKVRINTLVRELDTSKNEKAEIKIKLEGEEQGSKELYSQLSKSQTQIDEVSFSFSLLIKLRLKNGFKAKNLKL